jgi:hypothetical protein
MALARIITRFPEESRELAENLRSRGFEVQTEWPGTTSAQPADLEITIEECDAEEALQRASAAKDAYAFVTPGAITGAVPPITAIPFIPQTGIQDDKSARLESSAVNPDIENLHHHGFGVEVSRSQEVSARPISDLESRPSVDEDAGAMMLQPEHSDAEQHISQSRQSETAMTSEPTASERELPAGAFEPQLVSDSQEHGETAVDPLDASFDVAPVEPIAAEPLQAAEHHDAEPEISGAVETQQPSILARNLETQPQPVEAEEVATAGEELHPVSFGGLTEPISVSPGTPGQNEFAAAASESLSSTGAEAPQPPEKSPSLGTLPISDWPIWQPISPEEAVRAATIPVQEAQPVAYSDGTLDAAMSSLSSQRELTPKFPSRRVRKSGLPLHPLFTSEKVFWRTATLAGIGGLILLLGMSAHRLSPLPASLQDRAGDLQAPQTRPAAAAPVDLKPVARQSRSGNKATRSSKSADSVAAPPATAASKVNLISSRRPIASSATVAGVGDTDIAEDTVVRYGGQSASTAVAPSQRNAPVKRNSNLN